MLSGFKSSEITIESTQKIQPTNPNKVSFAKIMEAIPKQNKKRF